ncbi:unnamed protein product, partial [Heterosigma akashiwo]
DNHKPFSVCFLAMDWKGLWAKHMDKDQIKLCHDDESVTGAYEAPKGTSLEDCFDKFTTPEVLDQANPWYCSRCKEHRQATKTLQLWRVPNILVLVLKRFEFRNALFSNKDETFVDFPIDGLDMSRYCEGEDAAVPALYDLFAVSNHMGRLGFGHYTAFARDFTDQGLSSQWHLYDDSSVRPVSEDNIRSQAAYMLFYRRRGDDLYAHPSVGAAGEAAAATSSVSSSAAKL